MEILSQSIESFSIVVHPTNAPLAFQTDREVSGEVIKFCDEHFIGSIWFFVHKTPRVTDEDDGEWKLTDLRTTALLAKGQSRESVLLEGHGRVVRCVPSRVDYLGHQRRYLQKMGKTLAATVLDQYKRVVALACA